MLLPLSILNNLQKIKIVLPKNQLERWISPTENQRLSGKVKQNGTDIIIEVFTDNINIKDAVISQQHSIRSEFNLRNITT